MLRLCLKKVRGTYISSWEGKVMSSSIHQRWTSWVNETERKREKRWNEWNFHPHDPKQVTPLARIHSNDGDLRRGLASVSIATNAQVNMTVAMFEVITWTVHTIVSRGRQLPMYTIWTHFRPMESLQASGGTNAHWWACWDTNEKAEKERAAARNSCKRDWLSLLWVLVLPLSSSSPSLVFFFSSSLPLTRVIIIMKCFLWLSLSLSLTQNWSRDRKVDL